MNVEVLNFQKRICKTKLGCLLIRYHELLLKCDLVYHPKYEKVWVRMPEIWINKENKLQFCYWPTQQKSDQFQKAVLKKIFDKYDLSVDKVKAMHLELIKKRNTKNTGQDQKE